MHEVNQPGHPRSRVTEAELDNQVLALFDQMRIGDDAVREWFRAVLVAQTKDSQADSRAQRTELQRQASLLVAQQDRLLNLRIENQIDEETFVRKQTELRDRLGSIKMQLDAVDRSHDENAELAIKVFELSQTLRRQWLTANYAAKRKILEIVCLNCRLNDVTLCPQMRKPFDVLVEGLSFPSSEGAGTIIPL
jgi:predicted amino acid-binding ACT domain protein